MRPAGYNKQTGFTLIEVMVAMLIMTVGLMALLQTLGSATHHNFSNKLRNDAVMVADRAMGQERVKPFSAVTSAITIEKVPFALGFVNYSVISRVTPVGSGTAAKRVQFTVSWPDKQVRKQHSLTTIISD